MKKTFKVLSLLVIASMLVSSCTLWGPGGLIVDTNRPAVAAPAAALPAATERPALPEPTVQAAQPTVTTVYDYESHTMEGFTYTWNYTPLESSGPTPKLRDDAESSGKGVTTTHDIGVHPGELAVIKGVTINVGGQTLGTPCALGVLTPGFYRNITGTEWRYEVYYLPDSDPKDPTGWSQVLATQAMEVERDLYGCSTKDLKDIPVFYSSEVAPFGQ